MIVFLVLSISLNVVISLMLHRLWSRTGVVRRARSDEPDMTPEVTAKDLGYLWFSVRVGSDPVELALTQGEWDRARPRGRKTKYRELPLGDVDAAE